MYLVLYKNLHLYTSFLFFTHAYEAGSWSHFFFNYFYWQFDVDACEGRSWVLMFLQSNNSKSDINKCSTYSAYCAPKSILSPLYKLICLIFKVALWSRIRSFYEWENWMFIWIRSIIYETWFPKFTIKPGQLIFACVIAPCKLQVVLNIL